MTLHPLRLAAAVVVVVAVALGGPMAARAQEAAAVTDADLASVFPAARRFSAKEGRPPVYEAYRADPASGREALAGYAFLTSDVPPEAMGYSGPIQVLVGMDLDGTLTGIRVLDYHESLRSSRGDFLSPSWFQGQYAGKHIGDRFRVRDDVDAISGATITSSAMSLGIRNAARRVAAAHRPDANAAGTPARTLASVDLNVLKGMTWADMLEQGMARQVGYEDVNVSVVYVRDAALGELLMGLPFQVALNALGESVHERHLMVVGIDGSRSLGPLPRLFLAQAGDTLPLTSAEFMDLKAITSGKLEGVFRRPGLWLVKRSLDLSAPFQVGLRRCCGDPPVSVEYVIEEPAPPVAPRTAVSAQPASSDAAPSSAPSADAPETSSRTFPAVDAASPALPVIVRAEPESAATELRAPSVRSGNRGPLVNLTAIFLLTAALMIAAAAVAIRLRRRPGGPS